jgi:predicted phosphodiesterase
MKYGIFSDIHGNLEALESVLEGLDDVEQYICIGDLVGYGANPNECIEEVKKLNPLIVAGNHDYAAAEQDDIELFNPYAKEAILWTRRTLLTAHKEYLMTLPLVEKHDRFRIVHATPHTPRKWQYVFTLSEARACFQFFKEQICFIGHSHIPFVVVQDGEGNFSSYHKSVIKLEPNKRYLINVGSVGQPRDGNWQSCSVIFESEKREVRIKRLPYNLKETQRKMKKAGLPSVLIERLSVGQ